EFVANYKINLCKECRNDLPIISYRCYKCAQNLQNALYGSEIRAIESSQLQLLCGNCLKNNPPFDSTITLFPYEFPITRLIIQLKFMHQLSHAHLLGQLLAQHLHELYMQPLKPMISPDLLLPVPLHTHRLRERGFNQAVEIAKPIS